MSDIKSMGLYRNVERILADLDAAGHAPGTPLTVDDLTAYDQYHYEGTDAVDDAVAVLGAGPETRVLDVGSGLGGPARYIADRSGSSVTALELQSDLDATAAELTTRTGLAQLVTHHNGDILEPDHVTMLAADGGFDGLVSMLCFLHIPDRQRLFASCAAVLRPGATMFIDDYVARGPLSDDDRAALADTVYCTHLPDEKAYRADVAGAGFTDVTVTDKTGDWTTFVGERLELFRAARPELVARYEEATVDSLDHFYSTVADLFRGGNLGGLRLTARRC